MVCTCPQAMEVDGNGLAKREKSEYILHIKTIIPVPSPLNFRIVCAIVVLVSGIILTGCNAGPEKKLPPDPKFVNFYADLLLVSNDTSAVIRDTVLFKKRVDSVYSAYGYDTTKVKQFVEDYTQTPERWQEFYTQVIARLKVVGGTSIPDAMQ